MGNCGLMMGQILVGESGIRHHAGVQPILAKHPLLLLLRSTQATEGRE